MATEEEPLEPDPKAHETESAESSIRGGWLRALLAFLCFILVQIIFGMIAMGITLGITEHSLGSIQSALQSGKWPMLLLLHQFVGFLGTLLLVILFRLRVDRRGLASLGLRFRLSPLLLGLLLGPLLMGVCSLILYQLGYLGMEWRGGDPFYLFSYFLLALVIALNEEILVRGYILNNLMRSMKPFLALLVSAGLFTGLHAFNPGMTPIGVLNLFLAGLLLGVTYLKDQQLAFPIGLHLSWNYAQGPLFGFDVSGLSIKHGSLLRTWSDGPSYLTGGGFGLEGSLLLSILQITLIIVLYVGWKKM